MIRVCYSNRLEKLADRLIGNLKLGDSSSSGSLFSMPPIVVPNRNIETYLKYEIARGAGIAAGLNFQVTEAFLGELLSAGDGESSRSPRLVHGAALRAFFLDLLSEDSAASASRPLPQAVQAYLGASGNDPRGPRPPSLPARRPARTARAPLSGDATGLTSRLDRKPRQSSGHAIRRDRGVAAGPLEAAERGRSIMRARNPIPAGCCRSTCSNSSRARAREAVWRDPHIRFLVSDARLSADHRGARKTVIRLISIHLRQLTGAPRAQRPRAVHRRPAAEPMHAGYRPGGCATGDDSIAVALGTARSRILRAARPAGDRQY